MKVCETAAICSVVILLVYPTAVICKTKKTGTSEAATNMKKRHKPNLTMSAKHPIVGVASMYNPFRPGYESGNAKTASGERYNPSAWTAAIRTDLRHKFGDVQYGRKYKPAYALVEKGDKKVIVKINDVGPLKPGRVIDFNERTMRYFDPTLHRGLIANVKVIPLPGHNWTTGPLYG